MNRIQSIRPSHIKISTRKPESADEYVPTEVECFFDNRRLVAWADVLFLCCLFSHLPKVCADLCSHLSKHCLVYSFISAVPVNRLVSLLRHDFILKPQYEVVACDAADVWLSCPHLTTALTDASLVEAACPLSTKVSCGITLSLNWMCAVLYSVLNICTSAGLGSGETLSLMNNMFKDSCPNKLQLNAQSFISSSHAAIFTPDKPFSWISLTDAQTKETPLLRFLSSSKSLQQFSNPSLRDQ
ncbi:LOW QUALITY PROTEIN: NADP-dependent oxidoreductase domain-containing protein 1 [Cololabis saira]|uniref:LOW QUALITY PROTEIN: NADP-dependent oxidoreductase domain-containing protein 1 n=1 Tax=Cololabis saira TaxID=129043 RepID=UPI002AD5779C|nr:LOW QUALITY PROTEIN: NADP-dependent oxidoreductase domain-containing protein 1 [Cololabis saira]